MRKRVINKEEPNKFKVTKEITKKEEQLKFILKYSPHWFILFGVGLLLVVITASHLGFFSSGDIDYSDDDVLYELPPEPEPVVYKQSCGESVVPSDGDGMNFLDNFMWLVFLPAIIMIIFTFFKTFRRF